MNILFITNASGPDYMSDMIFHGGKSLSGFNFYESKKLSYMYDDFVNKQNLYGRGFTIYGKIPKDQYLPLPDNLTNLLEDKFFDKIIYGSIWRCSDFFHIVNKIYKKEDVLFIDGEDEVDRINYNFVGKGKYFKREYNNNIDGVYPINFGIPKELIIDKLCEKDNLISNIIPNFNRTYHFEKEEDYYNEYAKSWYAHTQKKGGWDCLRHYEIMMNGCIPIFENLENCPKNTMVNFPKKEVIKFSEEKKINKHQNEFILEFTKKNLTTKNIIQNIIK